MLLSRFLPPAALLCLSSCFADSSATTAAIPPAASAAAPPQPPGLVYPWLAAAGPAAATVATRFAPPPGCRRVAVEAGSWGEWLRWLPLLPAGTPARLYDGRLKTRQDVVAAVVSIDVGRRDLQQCADAVMRLRAEYLFSQDPNKIHFYLTSGYEFWFSDYVAGRSFKIVDDEAVPATKAPEAPTHAALARYLVPTFGYAGTLSLRRELRDIPLAQVLPGDVLIHGGAPGHAVLVLDVAEHPTTHVRYVLLAQSYMPAQSIHVLKDVDGPAPGSAWFAVPGPEAAEFNTPEWTFGTGELGRF